MRLNPLLLAGGRSSRMGVHKEFLPLPDGRPIFVHLLSILREACPESETVFVSQRDGDATKDLQNDHRIMRGPGDELVINTKTLSIPMRVVYDRSEGDVEIGPAAGLLAAYHQDATANWLVVACDYPLLSVSALVQLREEMAGSVTCFCNEDGFCEPLLGIWTPEALQTLEEHVRRGVLGPKSVVLESEGKTIRPRVSRWLLNTNTPEDWERAMMLMEDTGAG